MPLDAAACRPGSPQRSTRVNPDAVSIRFGKLNHCTPDEANPASAKCLENTVIPPGHHGPLVDRCQPARRANSLFGPEQLPA